MMGLSPLWITRGALWISYAQPYAHPVDKPVDNFQHKPCDPHHTNICSNIRGIEHLFESRQMSLNVRFDLIALKWYT